MASASTASENRLWIKLFFAFAWCQFAILTGFATYLLLAPDPGDSFQSVWDKLLHVICWFCLLGSLKLPCLLKDRFWRLAIVLFLYSFLIEFAQHFLPPRTFSWFDVMSNGIGIVLALVVVLLFDRWLRPSFVSLLRLGNVK